MKPSRFPYPPILRVRDFFRLKQERGSFLFTARGKAVFEASTGLEVLGPGFIEGEEGYTITVRSSGSIFIPSKIVQIRVPLLEYRLGESHTVLTDYCRVACNKEARRIFFDETAKTPAP